MKISEENVLEKLMDRVQCDRDKNFLLQNLIDEVAFTKEACCYSDGVTIEPPPDFEIDLISLTINGVTDILTISP